MQRYGTIAKALLGLAAIFCLFRYVADFTSIQSAFLSIALFCLYTMIHSWREANTPFVPYSVFVRPNLHAILTDFEFATDTEEWWAELRAGIEELPKAPWNIWDSGFSVSFVTPKLIYKNAWNGFATEVDLYADLQPVGIDRNGQVVIRRKGKDEGVIFRPLSPSLHLEPGNHGYRLSIELREGYWQKIQRKEVFKAVADRDVNVDHVCGSAKIQIALIPYEEFSVHFWVKPGDSGAMYQDAVKRRAEARRRFGWSGKSQIDMYERETTADYSDTCEHKYFSISHSAL